jgi:cobalt/nickel transport system permease protein
MLRRIDPRTRLLGTTAFAVVVIALQDAVALAAAVALAVLAVLAARVPARTVLRRLLALDGLMLVVLATLPFSVPGEAVATVAGIGISREGIGLALGIAARANAIVLMLLALLSPVSPAALGHALGRLGAPAALVHLLLFTIRYLDVLADELARLRRAMKARCFQPRTDGHTWRSFGWLVGMLMVRSFERAERVLAAMKCRGYDGQFRTLEGDNTRLASADLAFGCAAMVLLAGLAWLEAAR